MLYYKRNLQIGGQLMNKKDFHALLQQVEALSPSQLNQLRSRLQTVEKATVETLVTTHVHTVTPLNYAPAAPAASFRVFVVDVAAVPVIHLQEPRSLDCENGSVGSAMPKC